MRPTEQISPDSVESIVCKRCGRVCRPEGEYGLLCAAWGAGSKHAGESYELHLCEPCFFALVSAIKRERWAQSMFTQDADALLADESFGRVDKQ